MTLPPPQHRPITCQEGRYKIALAKSPHQSPESQVRGRTRGNPGQGDPNEITSSCTWTNRSSQERSPSETWRKQDAMEKESLPAPEEESRKLNGSSPEDEEVAASRQRTQGDGLGMTFHQGPLCTESGAFLFRELRELMSMQCSTWSVFRERAGLIYSDCTSLNVMQIGICFMQILVSMPREACREGHRKTTPIRRQRDLLPLPLPPVIGAAVKMLKLFTRNSKGFVVFDGQSLKRYPQTTTKEAFISRACSQIWRFNCTAVLSGQYLERKGPLYPNENEHSPAQVGPETILKDVVTISHKIPSKV